MATNKRLIKSNDEGGAVAASFNTVLYDGNDGVNPRTDVGFQPDFVWIKARTDTRTHSLIDTVRGVGSILISDGTIAEFDGTPYIQSFDSNGFTVKSNAAFINSSSQDYVAWCWKAAGYANTFNVLENGSTTSSATAGGAGITAGSITNGWSVSANRDAGFSIVSYNGGNSSGTTVGHGLGKQLDMLIVKNRNNSTNQWITWHKDVERNSTSTDSFTLKGGTILTLNTSSAAGNYNYDGQMGSIGGENLIAYCFAEVAGFSKFGVYNGTNAAGNKQTIGFEPSLIIFKITNQSNRWFILDNKRDGNPHKKFLDASSSDAEISNSAGVNFLLDGFDFQGTSLNNSGLTFTYMAFANQF